MSQVEQGNPADRGADRPSDRASVAGQQSGVPERFAGLRELAAGLPLPGHGRTVRRWQVLADVARDDLAVAKLFESHADALAILAELDAPAAEPAASWAVWAAEAPDARLELAEQRDGTVRLHGRKAWCSGARLVSHGLLTAWTPDGRQQLVAVSLAAPGIGFDDGAWHAVGMGRVATPDLSFQDVPAVRVGRPGDYTARAGFWQGGCGIAACWYGGALALADAVAAKAAQREDPHLRAHLGTIDVAIGGLRALLVETAGWIDAHPDAAPHPQALRLRAAADATARLVLDHAGRALGAGPLCRDPGTAQHFADLAVFIRQTHAERDLAALGGLVADDRERWQL